MELMEYPSNSSSPVFPWQATIGLMYLHLRKVILVAIESTNTISQKSPKKFTKEATYMIYVFAVYLFLAFLASAVTIYQFFFRNITGKNFKSKGKSIKKETTVVKGNKCWLENCKSFLNCFCLIRNGRRILNTVSDDNNIDCIEGLRFLSNIWIILCHLGMSYIYFLRDPQQVKPLLESWLSQLLLNGKFSVDMFFVVSGFLNAYFFSQKYYKQKDNLSWTFFYFKRFVRLTPVYMVVLGFHTTLYTYTGTGIIWPAYDTNPACAKDWWMHLLYINNFEESVNQCMVWCWYLAADMQFYIISPLFMIPLMRQPRFGYFLITASILASCGASFLQTYRYNLTDGFSRLAFHLDDIEQFFIRYWKYLDIVYMKPYTRISAYLIGLILGYFLHSKNIQKTAIRNRKVILYSGWIASIIFMWICFWSLHGRDENLLDTALYNGIKFLLFACSVAWIIYVCSTGQAEFLNGYLSWSIFLPLARLSYCAYLIHPIILLRVFQQAEDMMDYSVKTLMALYFYTCVFTYSVSFIASILVEIPMMNILEWLTKKNKHSTSILKGTGGTTKVSIAYKIS